MKVRAGRSPFLSLLFIISFLSSILETEVREEVKKPLPRPAIVSDGLTLVISPLLSLMEDQQVWKLKGLGIPAEILCSTTDKDVANSILRQLAAGSEECKIKILYVTPERGWRKVNAS
jgi:hypothetical protein